MNTVLTVLAVLVVSAFVTTIMVAMSKCPVWVPLVLLCIVALIQVIPLK